MTHKMFQEIVNKNQMLKKGVWLGRKMDVDNYYLCLLDLFPPEKLIEYIKDIKYR